MYHVLTISLPGLVASVNETINATNYAHMIAPAYFLTAAVERLSSDDHTTLDVLFAYVHSLAPELRDWAYEAEDDWLLLEHLTLLANQIRPIIAPLMPIGGKAQYYSHTDDTLTMLIKTPVGYDYGF